MDGEPNIFQDLSEGELTAVHKYLQEQASLNLTIFEKATLNDIFVYGVELFLRNKDDVLKYLDSGGSSLSVEQERLFFTEALTNRS